MIRKLYGFLTCLISFIRLAALRAPFAKNDFTVPVHHSLNGCRSFSFHFMNKIICSAIVGITCASIPIPSNAMQLKWISSMQISVEETNDVKFSDFLHDLESDLISEVKFIGVNPKYCQVLYKSGKIANVREGFPSYEDPKSPSGPTQVIAKVQHTPGVVCYQDISEALLLTSKSKKSGIPRPLPMLSHSTYPKDFI